MNWKTFYGLRPSKLGHLQYPFIKFLDPPEARPKLLNKETGDLLTEWRTPPHSALRAAEHALSFGGYPIARWDIPWGFSLAIALPHSSNGLIVLDDFQTGRFDAIGISDIDDVILASPPVRNINDEEETVKLLKIGSGREIRTMAEKVKKNKILFDPKGKARRRLSGVEVDQYLNMPIMEALKEIQYDYDPDPQLILGCTAALIGSLG